MTEWQVLLTSPTPPAKTNDVYVQNLYFASYIHHIDDMPRDESDKLLAELREHVHQPKYRKVIEWEQPGDMIIWDK